MYHKQKVLKKKNLVNDYFYSAGSRLIWISSGLYGEVWGINKRINIWRIRGASKWNPTGTKWQLMNGPTNLKQLSIYGRRVWGVDTEDKIYYATVHC